jgi:hypothetical protein
MPAMPGCETATLKRSIRLRPGAAKEETVSLRPCGSLEIDGRGRQGRFTVRALEGGLRKEGTFPMQSPLVLPIGRYSLTAEKTDGTDYCAAYTDEVDIAANKADRKSIAFLCQPAP